MRTLVALVALAVLSLAVPAFAAEPAPPDPAVVLAPSVAAAPSISLTVEQLQALVASAQAGLPMQPTKTAAVSAEGILGVSWATLAGWLGGLALMVFGLFKSAGALRARQMLVAAAEGAWHIAERAGAIYDLDGATKGALALEAFITSMGGNVNAAQVERARMLWQGQSAKAGLASDAAPVILAPPAAQLAQATAAAATSAQVAAGATATDLLKASSR